MALSQIIAPAIRAFRQIGPRRITKTALTMAAIIALGFAVKQVDFEQLTHAIDFNDRPDALWYQGRASYFLLGALFTAVGGPRQAVAFFAAYFFGLWPGVIVSTLATGLGCALAALFAKLFEKRVTPLISGRIDVAFDYWRRHPVATTLIIRLLPVGSNLITNLAAGATGIPFAAFLAASIIGYLPQMAVFGLMGSGVDIGHGWQISLGIALFAVLTVFGLWVYGRFRRNIRGKRDGELN
ncbi:MAG: VTT domain-containing protein [Nitratireductor sp.]|nr:VTT domain-containing protein [Nitratireductor sp.]